MKKQEQQKLEDKESLFFYNLLCQYETEENHKGYNIGRIDKEFKKKITLDNKLKTIVKPEKKNTILFKGSSIASDLLRHVRNAFAHCYIISRGNEFLLYDENKQKCTMYGRMNKADFYRLISEIIKTKQI